MGPLKRISLLVLFLFTISFQLSAQSMSAKEHTKLGEDLYERGEFAEAGSHLFKAWELKKKKFKLLYKAGLAYYYIYDYSNATKAFELLLEQKKKFPDVQLMLAKNQKSMGNYKGASKNYLDYIYEYEDENKEAVSELVQREIRGCELGMLLDKAGNTSGIELDRIDNSVNTIEDDYNPIPFDKKILYYASSFSGQSKFFRTEFKAGSWEKGVDPPLFPVIEGKNIGNGSFSPDFERFYFTQCENNDDCELYFIVKDGEHWNEPVRMKDYINIPGSSSSHPFVLYLDDKEIIYFSSDRTGGYGGKDLWYIVRDMTSNIVEYTFPTNLGKNINSAGDEIAPYYSLQQGNLYYSSNGKTTIGGFDIFRSKGTEAFWENSENVGLPFNSPADDYQYTVNSDGSMGYIVSNRSDTKKASTTDLDIFYFETEGSFGQLALKGSVFDEATKRKLKDVQLSIFLVANGGKKLLEQKISKTGDFRFQLDPDLNYVLTTTKPSFLSTESSFNTSNLGGTVEFEQNIFLVEGVEAIGTPPVGAIIAQSSVSKREKSRQAYINNMKNNASQRVTETTPKTTTMTAPITNREKSMQNSTNNTVEIEPINNKTVKITKPKPTSNSGNISDSNLQGNLNSNNSNSPNAFFDNGTSNNSLVNTEIIEANPVNTKHAQITTQGNAKPVLYPAKLQASTLDQDTRLYKASPKSNERQNGVNSGYSNTNSGYSNNNSMSRNTGIVEANPINTKRAQITTHGNARPVPYPEKLQASSLKHENLPTGSPYQSSRSPNTKFRVNDLSGVTYKVQICSVKSFNSNNSAFNGVRSIGNLETEYLSNRNLTRVLLGTFSDRNQAEDAAKSAKVNGFSGAFIVEYKDGRRLN